MRETIGVLVLCFCWACLHHASSQHYERHPFFVSPQDQSSSHQRSSDSQGSLASSDGGLYPASLQHDQRQVALKNISPECWVGAMNAVHKLTTLATSSSDPSIPSRHNRDETSTAAALGTSVCAIMTHDHQKALALELARCQLQDLERPLFVDHHRHGSSHKDCDLNSITDTGRLHHCLSRLSDPGMNSYTHFFTHVHQICTRLTNEIILRRHEESTMHLAQVSQAAARQLDTMLQHQMHLWEKQQERDKYLQAKQDEMLQQFQQQTSQLHKQHESMRMLQDDVWNRSLKHEQDMAQTHREWTQEQNRRFERQATEWNKYLQDMMDLKKTAERITPLLSVDSLLSLATVGLSWITSLMYFLVMMNAVWLFTLIKWHKETRGYMFGLLTLQLAVECLLHWMVTQEALSDATRESWINVLRLSVFALECILFMIGLLLFCFRSSYDDSAEQRMRQLEETMARQRQEALEREARLVQMWQHHAAMNAPVAASPPTYLAAAVRPETAAVDHVQFVPLPPSYRTRSSGRPSVNHDVGARRPRETDEQPARREGTRHTHRDGSRTNYANVDVSSVILQAHGHQHRDDGESSLGTRGSSDEEDMSRDSFSVRPVQLISPCGIRQNGATISEETRNRRKRDLNDEFTDGEEPTTSRQRKRSKRK